MAKDSSSLEFALTLLFALVTAMAIGAWTRPLVGDTLHQNTLLMMASGVAGGLVAWFLWRYRKGDYTSDK